MLNEWFGNFLENQLRKYLRNPVSDRKNTAGNALVGPT